MVKKEYLRDIIIDDKVVTDVSQLSDMLSIDNSASLSGIKIADINVEGKITSLYTPIVKQLSGIYDLDLYTLGLYLSVITTQLGGTVINAN